MADIYLELLKKAVEDKFGQQPLSTKQYNALSIDIATALGETLSTSTIKRLWGYVSGGERPRTSSLDILARYSGATDYNSFVASVKQLNGEQSDFGGNQTLRAEETNAGQEVELTWMPDRRVQLAYRGNYRWEVIKNCNSKLPEGAIVMFTLAEKGEPLYADVQLPGENLFRPYTAGKSSGISFRKL